jgi:DNA polymerase-3 subunit alpha
MQIAREMALYTLGGADMLRRCLSGSTQVVDVATGQCVSLQEIADNPDYWLGRQLFSLDLSSQKIVAQPITAIYPNGQREVWEVTTKTQRKIRSTADHLFYTPLGWQTLEQFAVGDSIGLARHLPITQHSDITDAQIKLTAYLIGDGHLSTKKPSHSYFCNSDMTLIDDFNACCVALFGQATPLDYQYHNGRKTVCYARIGFVSAFNQWVDSHIKRAHSRDKEIPAWVYELSATQLALFLGTLWSTDGSFDTAIGHTDYNSTSPTLIKQLQHLLLRLGIVALFNKKTIQYKEQPHISYRAQITGREDMLKFCAVIQPFLSDDKTQKSQLCYERVKDKLQNQSKHQLPAVVTNLISESKQVSGMTWSEIDAAVGVNKGVMSGGLNFTRPRQKLSRHRVRRFAEALQDKRLLAIANSEVFWDNIISIEYIGVEAVFDLTIPDTHNFIANDFIAHNCMGKKKPEEMAKERDKFLSGSLQNNVDESISTYVFDLMEKFSGYGFNKSHSAAYALVAYQTAWLKAHYPAEFMAAVLSSDMDNTDKVVILIEECRHMKLKILPPTINVSKYKFTVNTQGQIIYGLGALKGVGEAAIEEMLIEREQNGLFSGLYDLCKRVDLRKFNKRVLEALIRAGAFDEFDANRAAHWAELPTALRIAEQHGKMAAAGQNDLFGLAVSEEADVDDSQTYTTAVTPWSTKERLDAEKIILGLYLTGHPIDQYDAELKKFIPKTIAALLTDLERARNGNKVKVAGLAIDIGIRQNKQGKSRGTAILDDNTARLEITAHREAFDTYQAMFAKENKDTVLVAEGLLAMDDYLNVPRLTVDRLYSYDKARELSAKHLLLTWTAEQSAARINPLKTALTPFKGGSCPVQIAYHSNTTRATLVLGDAWRVRIADELLTTLKKLFADVDIKYK